MKKDLDNIKSVLSENNTRPDYVINEYARINLGYIPLNRSMSLSSWHYDTFFDTSWTHQNISPKNLSPLEPVLITVVVLKTYNVHITLDNIFMTVDVRWGNQTGSFRLSPYEHDRSIFHEVYHAVAGDEVSIQKEWVNKWEVDSKFIFKGAVSSFLK